MSRGRSVPDGANSLTRRSIAGFAVGDFGFNLFWTSTSLYLLYFYTDVLGLSPEAGGFIIFVCLIWDGITDPLMGALASRNRSRWGRYRPFVLFAAPVTGLSFWAMFSAPPFGLGVFAWALATHLVFRTAYTVQSIPYSSLMAVMTNDSTQRGRLASARMVAATTGGLLVAFFTLKLADGLGGGSAQTGFGRTAALYALAATLIFAACFAATRERVAVSEERVRASAGDLLQLLRRNTPFLLLFAATILSGVGGTFFSKTLVYWIKYGLGAEAAIGGVLAGSIAITAVSVPVWQAITRRTSKRAVWIAGSALTVAGQLAFFAVPPTGVGHLFAYIVLIGLGAGAFYLSFWSMLPDTVEFGLFRSGVRAESLQFGLISLAQKIALGGAVGALGLALGAIGYRADATQTPGTLDAMLALQTLAPALLTVLSALTIWFYPLDARLHGRLVRVLERRVPA